MEIDAAQFLPLDTKSAGFDNIADVQMLSPTLLEAYLNAASEISRLAVGDREASSKETIYRLEKRASQMVHVEGTPYGSRGGISVVHTFPADGEYVFWLQFEAVGKRAQGEQLEISFDGERVACWTSICRRSNTPTREAPRWRRTRFSSELGPSGFRLLS